MLYTEVAHKRNGVKWGKWIRRVPEIHGTYNSHYVPSIQAKLVKEKKTSRKT